MLTSNHNSPPAAAKEEKEFSGDTPEPLAEGRGPLHSRFMSGCQKMTQLFLSCLLVGIGEHKGAGSHGEQLAQVFMYAGPCRKERTRYHHSKERTCARAGYCW